MKTKAMTRWERKRLADQKRNLAKLVKAYSAMYAVSGIIGKERERDFWCGLDAVGARVEHLRAQVDDR